MRIIFTFLLISSLLSNNHAQKGSSDNVLAINFAFGIQLPAADLADRFGMFPHIGGGIDFITTSNWIIGGDGKFLYGQNVDELSIAGLFNEDGFLFGEAGAPASVQLRQRGVYLGGHIGKIFPIGTNTPHSGIRITIGAGFLQHKIRIQNDPSSNVPLLAGDYVAGFDRLTNGFALNQFVGYQYISKKGRINFLVGFDFTQGFTENQRNLNFDTRLEDNEKRLDLLNGFRISWTLPFHLNSDSSDIYY